MRYYYHVLVPRISHFGFPSAIFRGSRYLIPGLDLWIGVWQGKWLNRSGYWLRWWDQKNQLLLWGSEVAELASKTKLELINDRIERLTAQLKAAGIEPEI